MIHSMNVGHSYSDRKTRIFPYSEPGEYDDKYDLMSTANAHMRPSTYGLSGPGLNGPHLDYLGWLPQNRMVYFGRDGRNNYTLRLSSLSVPHRLTIGWLLVMIPYDRDDPGNVYTVEYRTPVGNDAAIRQGAVVIHKVHRVGNSYYSTLVTHERGEYNELTLGTEWLKFLDIAADGSFQYIRVKVRLEKTFGQNECKVGRIWRGIDAYDYVCVEPHRADEVVDSVVSIDDVDAGCDVDYVHRNAFQGDKACVSEDERALVHKENAESHLNLRNYAFFNGADSYEAHTSTYRLCGLCKVFTEIVRFGLSHNVISNIMLSRVDSVENFTDLTIGVGTNVERVIVLLADYFPLLKNVRMSEDQYDTLVGLTNRFLMALDYKLRTSTGEGLREHLKPCKHSRRRLK
ncbi:unnamed protein product [Haemonchus placei]|uniref:MATH domain-containing protein n=1 Tax=Haemonchus placei TaxID=6290 RepID=A0A158QNA9_HAEPC|nr:unnamed protein product [Haemonchus placei]